MSTDPEPTTAEKLDALDVETEQNAPVDGIVLAADVPAPMLAGTFAVYADGSGGMVLVADTVQPDGTPGVVHRKHIPAALVRLLNGGGGPAGAMLRRLAG